MKTRQKRSIVWKYSTEEFKSIISKSNSMADVCSHLGLRRDGGNYCTIKRRIKEENIDISHILNRTTPTPKWHHTINKDEFLKSLVNGAKLFNSNVKKKLIEFNIIPYKCEECKLNDQWNNKPISLHLDHRNGNSTDWQLCNLRFLCPNCHSQTDTYGGKKHKIRYYCEICKIETAGYSNSCFSCGNKKKQIVSRPTKEELIELIKIYPLVKIGKQYGVSDNAVRKWCKSYGIRCNIGRGYWS